MKFFIILNIVWKNIKINLANYTMHMNGGSKWKNRYNEINKLLTWIQIFQPPNCFQLVQLKSRHIVFRIR